VTPFSDGPRDASVRPMRLVLLAMPVLAVGCDPVLDVFGSFFPAWVVCMTVGIVLAAIARLAIDRFGLEEHLGPLLLVYPSLALMITMVTWLLFFST
jgi:hypothetical protein